MRRKDIVKIFVFLLSFLVYSLVLVYGESQEAVPKSPLPTAKMTITSIAVDGQILVFGGITKQGQFSSDVHKYDISTDKWTQETTMPTPRIAVAVAINHKIYVLGGRNSGGVLDKVEIYDTKSKSWRAGKSLRSSRWAHMASVINGKIYVIGGISGTGSSRRALNSMEIYDPDNNAWTEGPPLPTSKQGGAAVSFGGKVYVIGGRTGAGDTGYATKTVDIYDPLKNSWSSGKEMPQTRTGIQSVVIKDKIYVIGGAAGGKATNSIDAFDPAQGTWSTVASMKRARSGHGASSVGDRIYIIGGAIEMTASGIVDSVEMLVIK